MILFYLAAKLREMIKIRAVKMQTVS